MRGEPPLRVVSCLEQTNVQLSVAVFLAMIAGYLDGYGLLVLKTYVSFMSGNTTSTGVKIGRHDLVTALPTAVAIVSFVGGSFLGNLLTQSRIRHAHRILFGLIAVALATVASLDLVTVPSVYLGIVVLSLGMGMTNPALSKIGAESVSLYDGHVKQNRRTSCFRGCARATLSSYAFADVV